jgi:hypothetical protein
MIKTIFLKPIEKYSEKTLLLVGALLTLVGSFLAATFNVRYDGVLDAHVVSSLTFYQALLDNLINIFCLVLLLFLAAKYINRKTRFVDLLTTAMIARIPLYLLPLSNMNGAIGKATEELIQFTDPQLIGQFSIGSWGLIIIFAILALLLLIWFVALLYNGFKVASNAKGTAPIVLFILSLLFAELLSKVFIYYLN